jgi:hypothetical protein
MTIGHEKSLAKSFGIDFHQFMKQPASAGKSFSSK